jgi:hypothetical protein
MNELRVQDYQKFDEYLDDNYMLELGLYPELEIAKEQSTIYEENPSKFGFVDLDKAEIIELVGSDKIKDYGSRDFVNDGYIIVLHFKTKDGRLKTIDNLKVANVTDVTSDEELTDSKKLVSDKTGVNSSMSHSEQRNIEENAQGEQKDIFPHKKDTAQGSLYPTFERGKHPNSKKNLKPFEKGVSGNPSGRPTKYANLKGALDKWSTDTSVADFLGDPPSHATKMKERVHWRIWYKSTQGDTKCIEILAQLGCLDD